MTDLTIRAVMQMDASGMKPGADMGVAQLDRVKQAAGDTGTVARKAADVLGGVTPPVNVATTAMSRLATLGIGAVTLGLGALATTVVRSIWNMRNYQEEIRSSERVLMLYGNRLGMTTVQARQFTEAQSLALNISRRDGRSLLEGFVMGGGRSADGFQRYAELAVTWSRATGAALNDVQEQLQKALRDPTRAADELQGRLSGVTEEVYLHVRALQEQGDQQGAMNVLADAWANSARPAAENTSLWTKAMDSLASSSSAAYDSTLLAFGVMARFVDQATNPGAPAAAKAALEQEKLRQEQRKLEKWLLDRDDAQRRLRQVRESLDPNTRAFEQLAQQEKGIQRDLTAGLIGQAEATEALNLLNEKRLSIIERMLPRERQQREQVNETKKAIDALNALSREASEKLAREFLEAQRRKQWMQEGARREITGGLGGLSEWAPEQSQVLRRRGLGIEIGLWRNDALAAIRDVLVGHDQLAAGVEAVFNDRLAQLYEDDWRRRKDWAAGIYRANLDITRSTQDMARRSEDFLHGWAQTGEDIFARFSASGKLEIESLASFVMEQFARMAWQKNMAGSFNAVGGGILDMIGDALDMGGGKRIGGGGSLSMRPVTTAVNTAGIGMIVPQLHDGGEVSRPYAWRNIHPAYFDNAPRHHIGTGRPGSNELAVIVEKSEKIITQRQSDRIETALDTPMILPVGVGASAQPPVIHFSFVNQSGVALRGEQGRTKRQGDGSWSMEVLVRKAEDMIAAGIQSGNSPVGQALEGSYGMTRRPG